MSFGYIGQGSKWKQGYKAINCLEYDIFVLLPWISHVKPGLMFLLMGTLQAMISEKPRFILEFLSLLAISGSIRGTAIYP